MRRKCYSVILLDEIEKAHPEAFNMLLQIMEDGNLADAKGRKVDFRNTIIIMTSNVGAEQITKDMNLGFGGTPEDDDQDPARLRHDEGEGHGPAEADLPPGVPQPHRRTVVFHPLTSEQIREIVDLELERVRKQLLEQEITFEIYRGRMDLLGERGYDHTVRRASTAPHHPEPDRGSARRGVARGPVCRGKHRQGRC